MMTGCKTEMEKTIEETLYQKYGEEFFVRSVTAAGKVYYAQCSPIENEGIIFEVRIEDDGSPDEKDDYACYYIASLLDKKYKEDLDELFPDALFHSHLNLPYGTTISELNGKAIEDVLQEVKGEDSLVFLDIYYCDNDEYAKEYEKEFDYFSRINADNILQGKAVPLIVTLYKVSPEEKAKLAEFYKSHNTWMESNYCQEIFGCFYVGGDVNKDDLGTPEHISACFNEKSEGYVDDVKEYIRRRELLDNE